MHSIHVISHIIRDANHKCRESKSESQGLNAPPQLLLGGLIHMEAIGIINRAIGIFGNVGEAKNTVWKPPETHLEIPQETL